MKIHIGNLPKDLTDTQLNELVTPFGATTSVELAKDRDGSSKGFGFVQYGDDEHAKAAITALNGKDVSGNALKVSEARPRKGENAPATQS